MSSTPDQPQPPQPHPEGPGDWQPGPESGTEWLRAEGESHEVVLSSRVRLARNIAGLPFAPKAGKREREHTLALCKECVLKAGLAQRVAWVELHQTPPLERAALMERHLISKQLMKGRGPNSQEDPRAVAISLPHERFAIMINEEDHLRIQVIRSGLSLSRAWTDIDAIDDRIEAGLEYAFSPRLGYLTTCPTNVGTGLRMSVMLHLPGLRLTGEIEKVRRAADSMSLAVRGFYGEGSESLGDLYQVSNQRTLGCSEAEVLKLLETEIIPKIVEYERVSRRELLAKRRIGLEDQVWRAWGELTNARLLSADEAMRALSLVRLGVALGLLGGTPTGDGSQLDLRGVNRLLLLVQPAHLQKAVGRELDQEQRRVARATLVRTRLQALRAG